MNLGGDLTCSNGDLTARLGVVGAMTGYLRSVLPHGRPSITGQSSYHDLTKMRSKMNTERLEREIPDDKLLPVEGVCGCV